MPRKKKDRPWARHLQLTWEPTAGYGYATVAGDMVLEVKQEKNPANGVLQYRGVVDVPNVPGGGAELLTDYEHSPLAAMKEAEKLAAEADATW